MALQWKEILRSDGDLVGKVNNVAVATVTTGAAAGTTAKGVTDAAFTSNVLNIGNTNAASKNSAISISAGGVLSGAGGGTVTPTGIGAVDTDLSNAPASIKNANTTAGDVGLGSVLNQAQTSTFRQDGIPTALAAGDTWYDTNDDNKVYRATAAGDNEISASEWIEVSIVKGALGLNSGDVGLGNVGNTSVADIRSGTTAANVGLGDVSNITTAVMRAGVTAANVGLGNVANETRATILGGNLTGTVDGTAAGTIKSGSASGATANQDSTATILGGNLTGTVDGTAVATIKSGSASGATANQSTTATILGGNLTGTIGGTANATIIDGATKGAASPRVFRQDAIPTALNAGDTWFDTNDDNKSYRATATGDNEISSTEWKSITPAKGAVGLGNVDNESKATMFSSPTFSGTVAGVTKTHVGLGNVDDESKATMFTAPTFTGTVAGVTKGHVGLGNVDDQSSATIQAAAVVTAKSDIIGGSPGALDTLDELAAALGDDASFASSMTTSLASKDAVKVTMSSATAPAATGYAVGRQGIYSGKLFIVVDE